MWQSNQNPSPLEGEGRVRGQFAKYRRKRNFEVTGEPMGNSAKAKSKERIFVVQKHAARALHYDFRLEHRGVLKSWAVPKGPSLDPKVKRLAMAVEDHPLDYASFEGVIPEGQYGAGQVIVWDMGTWRPADEKATEAETDKALKDGELKFWLDGVKIRGGFVLVRTSGRGRAGKAGTKVAAGEKEQWLLIKHKDDCADPHADPTRTEPESVLSGLWIEDLATNG